MTRFVALLRGINVGGNNIIKMADLKSCCEQLGFKEVSTYIQSGNVFFTSPLTNAAIEKKLEATFSKAFNYKSTVLIRSESEMKQVFKNMPNKWKKTKDLRCYVAFLKTTKPKDAAKQIDTKPGIDTINEGPGVLYLTTKLSGISKSSFSKLSTKSIYKDMTIRNLSTTQKIAEKIQSKDNS